jgi:NAD(P)-dependent dehydrogenase (short-subunit alcohol dehydrogenase family)
MDAQFSSNYVTVVAGGSGLIGSKVVEGLLERGENPIILDFEKPKSKISHVAFLKLPREISSKSTDDAIERVESEYGPIKGLINCISTRTSNDQKFFADLNDYEIDTWNEVIEGNLSAIFLLCRAVGLRMKNRGKGSIVNFSSIYSSDLGPDLRIYPNSGETKMTTPVSYAASKGGVVALTKFLATTLGEYGVRVNCISPGGVLDGQSPDFVEAYSKRVPMGRMATSEEIAGLPIFLVSDESSYITGQNIYIDGGLSAW